MTLKAFFEPASLAVIGASADPAKMGQIFFYFLDAYIFWMCFIMKEDIVPDPIEISLFGFARVLFTPT